jgi:hypothetical protein
MSWLGRLFGAKPAPTPQPHTVIIDATLAQTLTEGGAALDMAVDTALRAYLDAQARAATAGETEGIPFWLRRDAETGGDIDVELRDRVNQRRAAEDEGSSKPARETSG